MEDGVVLLKNAFLVIQITYGPLSSVIKMPHRYEVSHYNFVVRSIPRHSSGLIGAPVEFSSLM